jgi:hypothetical protein
LWVGYNALLNERIDGALDLALLVCSKFDNINKDDPNLDDLPEVKDARTSNPLSVPQSMAMCLDASMVRWYSMLSN